MCESVWTLHGTRGQYDSVEYWTAAVCVTRDVALAEGRRLLEEEIRETFKRGREGYQAVKDRMPEFLDRAWNPSPEDEEAAIGRIEAGDTHVQVDESDDPPWQRGTEFTSYDVSEMPVLQPSSLTL